DDCVRLDENLDWLTANLESPLSVTIQKRQVTHSQFSASAEACYSIPMTLIVDINHWLEEDGSIPTSNLRLRRNALRVARFVEYGGPLAKLEGRLTLVECKRRPNRQQCLGTMWVAKQEDDRIQVHCSFCADVESVISGWDETPYAEGFA